MADVNAVVERYIATWNERDPKARKALVGTVAPVGGQAVAHGTDFAQLDHDGRFKSVIGFLDPVG
jgi:hypothetical protein